jgi:hypothetical protein
LAALVRLRVAAAVFAEAERSAAVRDDEAAPPFFPPFSLDAWDSGLPCPLPDFSPPPDSLLTVAQARLLIGYSAILVAVGDVLGLAFLLVAIFRFVAAGHGQYSKLRHESWRVPLNDGNANGMPVATEDKSNYEPRNDGRACITRERPLSLEIRDRVRWNIVAAEVIE